MDTTTATPKRRRRIRTGDLRRQEERRLEAAALFAAGQSQADVARALGVSRQAVSVWHRRWRQGGAEALACAKPPGPCPRLSPEQWQAVEQALLAGPRAAGYETDLWTLARVAELIERVTGVSYNPDYLSRFLRRHGWSRQRPKRRALQRDEETIAHWIRYTWPALKRGR